MIPTHINGVVNRSVQQHEEMTREPLCRSGCFQGEHGKGTQGAHGIDWWEGWWLVLWRRTLMGRWMYRLWKRFFFLSLQAHACFFKGFWVTCRVNRMWHVRVLGWERSWLQCGNFSYNKYKLCCIFRVRSSSRAMHVMLRGSIKNTVNTVKVQFLRVLQQLVVMAASFSAT